MGRLDPRRDRPALGGERSGRAIDDVDADRRRCKEAPGRRSRRWLWPGSRSLGPRTRRARSPDRSRETAARAVRDQSGSRTRHVPDRQRPLGRGDGATSWGRAAPAMSRSSTWSDAIAGGRARLDEGLAQVVVAAGHFDAKAGRLGSRRPACSSVDQAGDVPGQDVGGRRFRNDQVRQSRPALQLFITNIRADAQQNRRRGRRRPGRSRYS